MEGVKQLLRRAISESELQRLLDRAGEFKDASPKTRRQWRSVSRSRLAHIGKQRKSVVPLDSWKPKGRGRSLRLPRPLFR